MGSISIKNFGFWIGLLALLSVGCDSGGDVAPIEAEPWLTVSVPVIEGDSVSLSLDASQSFSGGDGRIIGRTLVINSAPEIPMNGGVTHHMKWHFNQLASIANVPISVELSVYITNEGEIDIWKVSEPVIIKFFIDRIINNTPEWGVSIYDSEGSKEYFLQ